MYTWFLRKKQKQQSTHSVNQLWVIAKPEAAFRGEGCLQYDMIVLAASFQSTNFAQITQIVSKPNFQKLILTWEPYFGRETLH